MALWNLGKTQLTSNSGPNMESDIAEKRTDEKAKIQCKSFWYLFSCRVFLLEAFCYREYFHAFFRILIFVVLLGSGVVHLSGSA